MASKVKTKAIAEQARKDLVAGIVKWSVWTEQQVWADEEMVRFVVGKAAIISIATGNKPLADYDEIVAGLAHKAVHEIATEKPFVGASVCLYCYPE